MPAENKERMADFYTRVFGWQTQTLGPEMGGYVLVTTTPAAGDNGMPEQPGAINGGFYEKSEEMPVQHPSQVIEVGDLEEAIQKVLAVSPSPGASFPDCRPDQWRGRGNSRFGRGRR